MAQEEQDAENTEHQDEILDEESERQAYLLLAASCTKFATTVLNFQPFPYQMKMLEDPSKKVIVCAARGQVSSYGIQGALVRAVPSGLFDDTGRCDAEAVDPHVR